MAKVAEEVGVASPELDELKALLTKWMRVGISDGRWVVGRFVACDYDGAVVLSPAYEMFARTCTATGKHVESTRYLAVLVVPVAHITSLQVSDLDPAGPEAVAWATRALEASSAVYGRERLNWISRETNPIAQQVPQAMSPPSPFDCV